MDLQERFNEAIIKVKSLPEKPSNEDLLTLYSFFKQGTEGDATGEKPGIFDFKGTAKFNAWEQLKGTSKESAMQSYIDKVEQLFN